MELDRDRLAQASHDYYCHEREAPDHTPDENDFDKADEVLEIMARYEGLE